MIGSEFAPRAKQFQWASGVAMACAMIAVNAQDCGAAVEGSLQIDNPVVTVGENGSAYYAQSFTAPNGGLDSATIELASAGGNGDSLFRVLISKTAGSTAAGIYPTDVLFESPTLNLPLDLTYPINQNDYTTFVVPLGGLQLMSGQTYALVIDCFSDFDGVQNFMGTGLNGNAYAGGHFFYYGIGFHEGDAGSRVAHFADSANWVDYLAQDLAFELHYTPVPEPVTWRMSVIVLAMLAGRRRLHSRAGRRAVGGMTTYGRSNN